MVVIELEKVDDWLWGSGMAWGEFVKRAMLRMESESCLAGRSRER